MAPFRLLTGHCLTRLEPGPLFKCLLDAVREAQLDGAVRNPQEARDLVGKLLKEWDEAQV